MKTDYSLSTSVGWLTLVEEDDRIVSVCFGDHSANHRPPTPLLKECEKQIREYLNGTRTTFSIPYALSGTPFQRKVWEETARIPYGEVCSYGELAQRIGHPKAYRAVGNAMHKNPLVLLIPCHRVIAANGKLGGYAGKEEIKITLLELEKPD